MTTPTSSGGSEISTWATEQMSGMQQLPVLLWCRAQQLTLKAKCGADRFLPLWVNVHDPAVVLQPHRTCQSLPRI